MAQWRHQSTSGRNNQHFPGIHVYQHLGGCITDYDGGCGEKLQIITNAPQKAYIQEICKGNRQGKQAMFINLPLLLWGKVVEEWIKADGSLNG